MTWKPLAGWQASYAKGKSAEDTITPDSDDDIVFAGWNRILSNYIDQWKSGYGGNDTARPKSDFEGKK